MGDVSVWNLHMPAMATIKEQEENEMTIREGKPCGCGSNKPRRALYDGNGFFCSYVCDDCEQKVRSRYRPEIMNRAYNANDVDEDIWGDERWRNSV